MPARMDISHEDLEQQVDSTLVYVIDLRQPSEVVKSGMIENAINIPAHMFVLALQMNSSNFRTIFRRPKPKITDTIVVYGSSDTESQDLRKQASRLGYQRVKYYKGGYAEWEKRRTYVNEIDRLYKLFCKKGHPFKSGIKETSALSKKEASVLNTIARQRAK